MDYLEPSVKYKKNKKEPFCKTITDVKSYVKELEELWKNHYNVHVYTTLRYPPDSKNKKNDRGFYGSI